MLKRAKRQKHKRKGDKIIDYALVPIGVKDNQGFERDGYTLDYSYATHWLTDVSYCKDIVYLSERVEYRLRAYRIRVFPCTEKGRTDQEGSIHLIFYDVETEESVKKRFNRIVDDMKNDCYWESEY